MTVKQNRDRFAIDWKKTHNGGDLNDVLAEYTCASYRRLTESIDAGRKGAAGNSKHRSDEKMAC